MTHIVDSCPESSLDGDLPRLHSADEYAITWLNSVAKEALAKWNNCYTIVELLIEYKMTRILFDLIAVVTWAALEPLLM